MSDGSGGVASMPRQIEISGNKCRELEGLVRFGLHDDGILISDVFFYGFKRKAHVGAEFLDG